MQEEILSTIQKKMSKTLAELDNSLSSIRTDRANPSLLEKFLVDYYGSKKPISQVATITVEDARTLKIVAWERTMSAVIEKAILASNLGLTPTSSDGAIRINLPILSQQRRHELVKIVQGEGEKFRISIRNIRREANNECKKLLIDKEISEDENYEVKNKIQQMTDQNIAEIDSKIIQKQQKLQKISFKK